MAYYAINNYCIVFSFPQISEENPKITFQDPIILFRYWASRFLYKLILRFSCADAVGFGCKNSFSGWSKRLGIFLKTYVFNITSGNVDQDFNFENGVGAFVDRGCAATFFGEMWYFGGDVAKNKNGNVDYRKQVCSLNEEFNT